MPTPPRTNEEIAEYISSWGKIYGDKVNLYREVLKALDQKDRSWIDVVNAQQENIEALERLARALKEKCNSPTTPPL